MRSQTRSGIFARRRYPSARDWWLVAIIWGTAILTAGAGIRALQHAGETPATPVFLFFLVATEVFLFWILYGTWYEIDRRHLCARCGPFRMSVPLETIGAVVPTRNPLSSMALSLDRLAVSDRAGRLLVLISPRDRERFLRDLAAQVPGLVYAGGEVRRR